MDWQWFLAILPGLLFLACPLAMFLMMRGTSHGEGCAIKAANREGATHATTPRRVDEEIDVLRVRLALLEARDRLTGVGS